MGGFVVRPRPGSESVATIARTTWTPPGQPYGTTSCSRCASAISASASRAASSSRASRLYEELDARGLPLRPTCYLGDEWFTPTASPRSPFPSTSRIPRLKALELHQMLEVEGGTPEWCAQLLRHECGHALDHAYRFSSRRGWRAVFGSPDNDYEPEIYRPRPYSRSFVRHLPNWYAQAHPDEDFAETFAVWLAHARGVARALPRVEGAREARVRRRADARGAPASRRSSATAGAAPTPRRCARRSRATTPRAASCTRRTSRTSTTPTCGASSRDSPRRRDGGAFMRRRARRSCRRRALDRRAQVHRRRSGAAA